MALKSIDPSSTPAWRALEYHYGKIKDESMLKWFEEDSLRADKMRLQFNDFYLDYSKNRMDDETMALLLSLADQCQLQDAIHKYFGGDQINETEGRAVLHTALRAQSKVEAPATRQEVFEEVQKVKSKISDFSTSIISGNRKGYTRKAFTDVVNIGIGGSDLGPSMVVEALAYYGNHLKTHFVSNVDGDHVNEVIRDLNPETTLFIVVSKSFTTQETLSNATTIRKWFLELLPEVAVPFHFVAVSSNIEKVVEFGIDLDNIFPMWNWVGGRFSLWSAVGLSISLAVGYENYESLLKGANEMDVHFKEQPFAENMPVVMALISIWYNNFFNIESEAVIPYSQYLNSFATYLQQAVMESNGKGIDRSGKKVTYQTGNIIWGEPGTNSQHAFFQLIHQGTKLIPADFIGFTESLHGNNDHHDKLMANYLAQTEALLKGKSEEDVLADLAQSGMDDIQIGKLLPFKIFEGNRPTNSLLIDKLTPRSLGKLIALYEHKIFVQGVIWNIFSFDQFGVELGKQLAGAILEDFSKEKIENHDPSTTRLIRYYKSSR